MRIRLAAVTVLFACASVLHAQEFVWLEGEQPASGDFGWTPATAKQPELLSEGHWLQPKDRRAIKKGEVSLAYEFEAPSDGTYDLWLRIGFEWVRPRVRWAIDDGDATLVGLGRASPPKKVAAALEKLPKPDIDRMTTNVTELDFWCEAGWWNIGKARLSPGRHTLHLTFLPSYKPDPVLALDAICLVKGAWTPDGPLRPGETYSREKDREAAKQVFRLPSPKGPGDRSEVDLTGLWQIARYDDPDMDAAPFGAVQALPSPEEYTLHWQGVPVPGNLADVPGFGFAHRVVYRAKVAVPEDLKGHSFFLHFSGTNWIASVFVNGKLAGERMSELIPWDLDITPYVEPGKENEIAVAIKGSYYAIDARGSSLNEKRNIPYGQHKWTKWLAPIYPSNKGDGNGLMQGLVNPVRLTACGAAYTADVFVRPTADPKAMVAEVTLANPGKDARQVAVHWEAIDDRTGKVAKTFAPAQAEVPAGGETELTLKEEWEDAKFWWPEENPQLYRLRIRLVEGNTPLDTAEQLFGFREVTWKGPAIFINGVRRNFWNWVDVKGDMREPGDWARHWRRENNHGMRFSYGRRTREFLPAREDRLTYYDRQGVAGRLCSMIDGMFVSYWLMQMVDGEDGKKKQILHDTVWDHYRRHVAQMVKAHRNHPSVIFYQVENELIYINGMNLYGSHLPLLEKAMLEVAAAGRALDPTRPYSVGGAGDLGGAEGIGDPSEALEINCPHYPAGQLDWYPENAYTLDKLSSKVARWSWHKKKPWMAGESAYAGHNRYGSYVDGGGVYRSQDAANRGKAKYLRMLYGGYRWAGVAGFFPWDNLGAYEGAAKVFHDLYIIPRKQAHRLYGGQPRKLRFKAMNDTFHKKPVTVEWTFDMAGAKTQSGSMTLDIEPGYGKEFEIELTPPAVASRMEGVLRLRSSMDGAPAYEDERILSVLPEVKDLPKTATPLLVYDPAASLAAYLKKTGLPHQSIDSLETLPEDGNALLLIGADALTAREAFGNGLLAFAARGGRVLCLEQTQPVGGANLPVPVETTDHYGGYAHPQALGTALFRDLGKEDLIDWAGDHPTYRNVHTKPDSGARSLVECGPELPYSALMEAPAGKGVMLLTQLRVGAKLGLEPAADVLLRNMIAYCDGYRTPDGVAAVFAPERPLLLEKAEATGARCAAVDDLSAALDAAQYAVVLVDATRANLDALLAMDDRVKAYQEKGGWVMLCNVRPDSMDAFNKLVGAKHLLRPYRLERNHLQDTDTPVAVTISDADVMLYSPKLSEPWAGRYWVSPNTFDYVIDSSDAAPFTYPPEAEREPFTYTPLWSDRDPYNFVNNIRSDDSWRYIRQIWIGDEGPAPMTFTLRQPETLQEIRIWNNAIYSTIEDLEVILDGDEAHPLRVTLPDSAELTVIDFPEPRRVEKTIRLDIKTWRAKPAKKPGGVRPKMVGIDAVSFVRAARPSDAKVIDKAGGLAVFERGQGGFVLSQIQFMDDEPRPANDGKKVRLLATMLRNLGCGAVASSRVAAPGVNVDFETIDINDWCTQYMTHREGRDGLFGPGPDLTRLEKGKQHFARIPFHVPDYATAPVPDCIVLGGLRGAPEGLPKEVKGIRIGKKADMLYFLQTAKVTRPVSDRERQRRKYDPVRWAAPEVLRYVLHYEDGEQAVIPVVLEEQVDNWLRAEPEPLPGAQIAWTASTDKEDETIVLYLMQAANPHPEKVIATMDILPGLDFKKKKVANRAVPAVLGITVGEVR